MFRGLCEMGLRGEERGALCVTRKIGKDLVDRGKVGKEWAEVTEFAWS